MWCVFSISRLILQRNAAGANQFPAAADNVAGEGVNQRAKRQGYGNWDLCIGVAV